MFERIIIIRFPALKTIITRLKLCGLVTTIGDGGTDEENWPAISIVHITHITNIIVSAVIIIIIF